MELKLTQTYPAIILPADMNSVKMRHESVDVFVIFDFGLDRHTPLRQKHFGTPCKSFVQTKWKHSISVAGTDSNPPPSLATKCTHSVSIFWLRYLFYCLFNRVLLRDSRARFVSTSVALVILPLFTFWAAAPKGTKSCRTQGTFVRSFVRSCVPPRPSRAWNLPSQA